MMDLNTLNETNPNGRNCFVGRKNFDYEFSCAAESEFSVKQDKTVERVWFFLVKHFLKKKRTRVSERKKSNSPLWNEKRIERVSR